MLINNRSNGIPSGVRVASSIGIDSHHTNFAPIFFKEAVIHNSQLTNSSGGQRSSNITNFLKPFILIGFQSSITGHGSGKHRVTLCTNRIGNNQRELRSRINRQVVNRRELQLTAGVADLHCEVEFTRISQSLTTQKLSGIEFDLLTLVQQLHRVNTLLQHITLVFPNVLETLELVSLDGSGENHFSIFASFGDTGNFHLDVVLVNDNLGGGRLHRIITYNCLTVNTVRTHIHRISGVGVGVFGAHLIAINEPFPRLNLVVATTIGSSKLLGMMIPSHAEEHGT